MLRLLDDPDSWWVRRAEAVLDLVDIIRLDHFRGFAGYWAVPYGETTAINGRWETGPGKILFDSIRKKLGSLPIIAEDLGLITPDVHTLRNDLGFPGMKVLQFAFDSDTGNDYLPHRYDKNCVVYTGTHDNDTTAGWFEKLDDKRRDFVKSYAPSGDKTASSDLLRLAWSSTAKIAVAPLQDILGLGSSARMNTPGTASGNWQWRFERKMLTDKASERLRSITELYQR